MSNCFRDFSLPSLVIDCFGPEVRLQMAKRVYWSSAIQLMGLRKQRQTNRTPNMISFHS